MTKSFNGDAANARPMWSGQQGEDATAEFDLVLNRWQKATVKAAMKGAGVEENVRSTIRDLAGQGFTSSDLGRLEERMLDTATWDEATTLWVVEGGPPVVVDPKQKAALDGLFGRLGGDPLAERARASYRRALRDGRVKVR